MLNQMFALMGSLALLVAGMPVSDDLQVHDGDTFFSGGENIRILNINTPEQGERCFEESRDALEQLLNSSVETKRDVANRDKYGRLLRHLFFEDKLLQEKMVSDGNAKVMCVWPNLQFCDRLMELEQEAVNRGAGCLFKPAEPEFQCVQIADVDCGGSWFEIQNNCGRGLEGIWAESRGREKVELETPAGASETVHLRLFENDAVYLFHASGLIDFEAC